MNAFSLHNKTALITGASQWTGAGNGEMHDSQWGEGHYC